MTLSNLRIMGDINASKENLSIQESTQFGENLHYDSDGQVNRIRQTSQFNGGRKPVRQQGKPDHQEIDHQR